MIVKLRHFESTDGRRWLLYSNTFQCAACLYVQPSHKKLREKGLVVGYVVDLEDEQHSEDCMQKT